MKGNEQSHPSAGPANGVDHSIDVLGHELDNVLNGMLGMARMLRESGLNPEQERWSRAIEHSGRQLRRLVSAFRSETAAPAAHTPGTGNAGSVRAAGTPAPVDGIDLLEQAVLSQAPLALAQRNRLLLDVDPQLPRFWNTDPCRLRQLLDNLLGNANKFTRDGEIVLRAACVPAPRRCLSLEVTDTGPGVDPRSANRIFEAGQRGREGGGSGLGLYVCRGVAAELGGTIGLSSPPGGGARFTVELPGLPPAAGPRRGPLTRAFGRLDCRLELQGALRASVAGWLTRLGAPWRQSAGSEEAEGEERLTLRISELPAAGEPAPLLHLAPHQPAETGAGPDLAPRRLAAPITGASLGPVLLEMLLEWSWQRHGLRRGRPG